ncbi:MAG: LAGLIDADG family homing endonuclease, partial [Candidatus Nanohaloarchaea archaeon]|nr:LAGLIDADG family homing endonuclease [Candidatus Nanohaloarchaea archaeon]
MGVARDLPLETDGVDINSDWRERISDRYEIIDHERFTAMAEETDQFRRFETFSQIDSVRRLLGESKQSFAEKAGISSSSYRRAARGESGMSADNKEKLVQQIRKRDIDMGRQEIILVPESEKDYRQARFEEFDVDKDFVHFTAFLLAEVQQVTDKDFRVNSKGFVDYLQAKFGFTVGDSTSAGLPDWIHSLPRDLKAEFLRWFFTFEADINPASGQITLMQANKDTINRISYLLQEFGVRPRLGERRSEATNTPDPVERTYYTLTVSGSQNIQKFVREIGVEAREKQAELEETGRDGGKTSSHSVPVDLDSLDQAVSILKSKHSNTGQKTGFKQRSWYSGFEDAKKKGELTRGMFEKIQETVQKEVEEIRGVEEAEEINRLMDLAGVTAEEIASEMGRSVTQTKRFINREKGVKKQEEAFEACQSIAEEKVEESLAALEEIG